MTPCRHAKELTEMKEMWNCAREHEAAQKLIQAYYILKGNRPAATDFVLSWSDDLLIPCYVAVMDYSRRTDGDIDLLALQPTKKDQ